MSSVRTFLSQSRVLARNTLAGILIAYGTHRASAQSTANERPAEVIDDDPAQPEHMFVLSHQAFAAHFNLQQNWHSVMAFGQELIAVRFPKFVGFAIIFTFALVLAYVLPMLFDEILRRFQTPRNFRRLFDILAKLTIVIIGLWLGLAAVGIDFFGIVLTFGVITIAVSYGIGQIVSNVFGGIMLQTNDRVQVGSDISIQGIRGVVVEMTLECVMLQSHATPGAEECIPNHWFGQFPVTIFKTAPMGSPPADRSGLEAYVVDPTAASKSKFS